MAPKRINLSKSNRRNLPSGHLLGKHAQKHTRRTVPRAWGVTALYYKKLYVLMSRIIIDCEYRSLIMVGLWRTVINVLFFYFFRTCNRRGWALFNATIYLNTKK